MSKIRRKFAQNLKTHREQKNISQEQLAEKLGINVRYIQQLEGKNTPNVKLDTIASLAKALRIKAEKLLEGA